MIEIKQVSPHRVLCRQASKQAGIDYVAHELCIKANAGVRHVTLIYLLEAEEGKTCAGLHGAYLRIWDGGWLDRG